MRYQPILCKKIETFNNPGLADPNNPMGIDPNTGFNRPTVNDSQLKILEFAIDMETGEKYNLKTEASKVIALIKKDSHFQNTKMKKKDVSIYITQYNKRHPIEIGAD